MIPFPQDLPVPDPGHPMADWVDLVQLALIPIWFQLRELKKRIKALEGRLLAEEIKREVRKELERPS